MKHLYGLLALLLIYLLYQTLSHHSGSTDSPQNSTKELPAAKKPASKKFEPPKVADEQMIKLKTTDQSEALRILNAEEWVKAENEKLNDPNTVSVEYYNYFMNLTIEEKKREIEIFEKEIAFDELSISSYRSLGDEDLANTIENRALSKKIQLKDFKFHIQREKNYLDQHTE